VVIPINEAQHTKLDKLLDATEISKAIQKMKNGSTPGPDGLSAKLYKSFTPEFSIIFKNLYSTIVKKKKIPKSMRMSYITLLPKPNKNPLLTENWRPISLLNVDYKILTKVWANRLNPILQTGIDTHQTGFIPGRDIRENVILVQTIIDRMVCFYFSYLFLCYVLLF